MLLNFNSAWHNKCCQNSGDVLHTHQKKLEVPRCPCSQKHQTCLHFWPAISSAKSPSPVNLPRYIQCLNARQFGATKQRTSRRGRPRRKNASRFPLFERNHERLSLSLGTLLQCGARAHLLLPRLCGRKRLPSLSVPSPSARLPLLRPKRISDGIRFEFFVSQFFVL